MSNAARKARKRAGIKFDKPAKVGIPHSERAKKGFIDKLSQREYEYLLGRAIAAVVPGGSESFRTKVSA